MSEDRKTLFGILNVPEAAALQETIRIKGDSPSLDGLDDPAKAMRFLRTSLCGSYLFARFAVPSYAAAVFSSLTDLHPADDEVGSMLSRLTEAVRGELFNNNIFGRAGECHAHHNDMREAYEAAGGDLSPWRSSLDLQRTNDLEAAMEQCPLWTPGSMRYARNLMACCKDPLALFIMMPANEELAPRVYARSLASLPRGGRFDKFRRFLETHVALDEGDHGPAFLDWLEMYLKKKDIALVRVRESTQKVLTLFGG